MDFGSRALGALATCVAGVILVAPAQVGQGFPVYPPTPDADPSTRHPVEVSIPARLNVQRTPGSLAVSYDLGSLRYVKITVGKKMTIGIKDELRVYVEGDERPSAYRTASESSMNEKEPAVPLWGANLLKSTDTLTSVHDGIPTARRRYIVEHDITVFETDIPAQHMWNPGGSRIYRVLWEERLKSAL